MNISRVKPFTKNEWLNSVKSFLEKYDFSESVIEKELEEKVKAHIDKKYALTANSGTNALFLILHSYKSLSKKREVLLTSYGHPAVSKICSFLGLIQNPIEMEKETLSMDTDQLEKNISENTLAVVHIESNGVIGKNIEEIEKVCKEHELPFIEDAAPSFLQEFESKRAGSFGETACFSFSPTKPLFSGEGSIIMTDNEQLYKQMKSFRYIDDFNDPTLSLNFKMSPLLAAYILPQFEWIDHISSEREQIHSWYRKYGLDIYMNSGVTNRYGAIMYLSKNGRQISERFTKFGIHHRYKYYPSFNKPIAKEIRNEIIDLPMHMDLKENEVKLICNVVRSAEK